MMYIILALLSNSNFTLYTSYDAPTTELLLSTQTWYVLDDTYSSTLSLTTYLQVKCTCLIQLLILHLLNSESPKYVLFQSLHKT